MHKSLKNKIIDNRYKIENIIGVGSFGQVFNCQDLENENVKLVIKISEFKNLTFHETNVINEIQNCIENAKMKNKLPKIIKAGNLEVENKKLYYIILNQNRRTL